MIPAFLSGWSGVVVSRNALMRTWGVLFYLLIMSTVIINSSQYHQRYTTPKISALFVLAIFGFFLLISFDGILHKINRLLAALLILCAVTSLISAFLSVDQNFGFWGTYSRRDGALTGCAFIFLAFLSAHIPFRKRFFHGLMLIFSLSACISFLFGLLQYLGYDYVGGWTTIPRTRPLGTIGGVNSSAGYLAMILPGTIWLFLSSKGFLKTFLYLTMLMIILLGLLMGYSRGAWMTALGGCILFLGFCAFAQRSILRWKKILVLFTAFIVAVILHQSLAKLGPQSASQTPDLIAISQSSLFERFGSTVDAKDATIQSRLELWKIAFEVWKKFPLWGSGPETFQIFYGRLRSSEESLKFGTQAMAEHAHNCILHLMATRGLMGTLPVILLWGVTISRILICIKACLKCQRSCGTLIPILSMWLSGLAFSLANVHTAPGNTALWLLNGWLWNPSLFPSDAVLSTSVLKYRLNALKVLVAAVLSIFGIAYFSRPVVADALLHKTIVENPTHVDEKTQGYLSALNVFPEDGEYAQYLIIYLDSLPEDIQKSYGCFPVAEDVCDRYLIDNPEDIRFLYLRAVTLFLWGQAGRAELYPLAENDARAVLNSIPYHLTAIRLLVEICLARNDKSAGMETIENLFTWTGLDYVQQRYKEPTLKEEVVHDCRLILYLARIRGNLLNTIGERAEAEEQFLDILQVTPEDGLTLYNLGVLKAEEREYDQAETLFIRALKAFPDCVDAKANLSTVRQLRAAHKEKID